MHIDRARFLMLAASVAAFGCDDGPRGFELEGAEAGIAGGSAERAPVAPRIAPLARIDPEERTGSAIVLARLGERRLALVSDEDGHAIVAVDLATRAEAGRAELAGRPAQLLVGADGLLYAALRDEARVAVLGWADGRLVEVGSVAVAAEPFGLAVTPDERTLLVTSGWAARLTGVSLARRSVRFVGALEREPRAVVAVSNDEAVVTHAMGGRVSRVRYAASAELEVEEASLRGLDSGDMSSCACECLACVMPATMTERTAANGFAAALLDGTVFAPVAVSHPGGRGNGGYNANDAAAQEEAVAEVPPGEAAPRLREIFGVIANGTMATASGLRRWTTQCILPRGAAVDRLHHTVLVSCLGVDAVIEIDPNAKLPSWGHDPAWRRRWQVPAGPTGVAVDGAREEAFVWSQFDRTVSSIRLDVTSPEAAREIRLSPPGLRHRLPASAVIQLAGGLDPEMERGRRLFHAVDDPRIARDGRACASCHPEGRDDGVTWDTLRGRRQTPMLAGRLDGANPFGWRGDTMTVSEHIAGTIQAFGGKGLPADDLAALARYVVAIPPPPRLPPAPTELSARGRALFESDLLGCSSCHREAGRSTDRTRHDVGTGTEVDTPTLAFIGGTAPYYHDGRFDTLRELILESRGRMGWSPELPDEDVDALEYYLTTL